MIRVVAMIALLSGPSAVDRWFGADKLKHFLMSALIQSTTFSAARAAGLDKSASQVAGGAAVVGLGLWKEIHDRGSGQPFSVKDLAWGAAGATAAGALLNGTR